MGNDQMILGVDRRLHVLAHHRRAFFTVGGHGSCVGIRPDLPFRDALDNDIEIVSNADKVLIYDRPIDPGGLLWRDLQAWWAQNQSIDDPTEAKGLLYRHLPSSPTRSP